MNLFRVTAGCSGIARQLLGNVPETTVVSKNFASGRWYPQPERSFSTPSTPGSSESQVVPTSSKEVLLRREDAAPVYYKPRGGENPGFALEPYRSGELRANYVLFEHSMAKAKVPWNCYDGLTTEERTIYMKHLQAIEERRLSYKDPKTGFEVFTVSHHLNRGDCCGNGCRHCPYEMEKAPEDVKKKKVWNGAYYV